MRFRSFFFLNERNIRTSRLIIHLKCTVVHDANLNLSCINKPFFNYGPSNMLFRFFSISHLCFFNEALVKKFMKNLSFFNTNFQNSFPDIVYYGILDIAFHYHKPCDTKIVALCI